MSLSLRIQQGLGLSAATLMAVAVWSNVASATTLTFALDSEGNAPSNNQDLNATTDNYGSNIATETPAFITSDGTGATPDIGLTWLPLFGDRPNVWELHNSGAWSVLDGASHPNAGAPYLNVDVDDTPSGQGFPDDPEIIFDVQDPTQAVHFDGLDFAVGSGYSGEPYSWTVEVIRQSDDTVVDSQNTGLLGNTGDPGVNPTVYLPINFTGELGVDYRLRFDDGGRDHFSTAIDNLSFSQVPEPAAILLAVCGLALGCINRRR